MHHLTKAAHGREVTRLLAMIGWPLCKMGLTTVMVLEGKVEALLALQGTMMRATMIALKLVGVATAPAGALGKMTGAPLMKMMTTTVAQGHLEKRTF